jgi:hypothetical protein
LYHLSPVSLPLASTLAPIDGTLMARPSKELENIRRLPRCQLHGREGIPPVGPGGPPHLGRAARPRPSERNPQYTLLPGFLERPG